MGPAARHLHQRNTCCVYVNEPNINVRAAKLIIDYATSKSTHLDNALPLQRLHRAGARAVHLVPVALRLFKGICDGVILCIDSVQDGPTRL